MKFLGQALELCYTYFDLVARAQMLGSIRPT